MTGVIFDVDGVLLDSMPIWMHAGERYLKRKGITPEKNLGEKLFSMSMEEGASYLKETYQLPESISTVSNEINQVVMDAYKYTIPLKTGVIETLQSLEQKNIPMVIATSSDEHIIRSALERLDIAKYFKKIVTCTEIGVGKNQPDVFLAAAEYIALVSHSTDRNYEDVYVVEDSLWAMQTAKQAGFTVIGIYDEASCDIWDDICHTADMHSKELKVSLFNKNS